MLKHSGKFWSACVMLLAAAVLGWAAMASADPPRSADWREARRPASQPEFRRFRGPHNLPPLTEPEVLDFLKTEQPDLWKELDRLRRQDRRRYEVRIEQLGHALRYLRELRKSDPERAKLLIDDMNLGRRINRLAAGIIDAADESARNELTAKLREALAARLEISLQRQRLEIQRMKKRIEAMEKTAETRQSQKDAVIEQQLKQTLEMELRRRERRPTTRPATQLDN